VTKRGIWASTDAEKGVNDVERLPIRGCAFERDADVKGRAERIGRKTVNKGFFPTRSIEGRSVDVNTEVGRDRDMSSRGRKPRRGEGGVGKGDPISGEKSRKQEGRRKVS